MTDNVTLSGPLFDGTAERASIRGTAEIRGRVAAQGERLARSALASSIRHHSTGRAEAAITETDKTRAYQTGKYTMPVTVDIDEEVVTSDLASYGPWLEGTGSRNETTHFKGYFSFRLASQALDAAAGDIADIAFQPFLREMQ